MPGVDRAKLRGQPDGALAQNLLGQVGVLDIHKIFRVKAADFLQHVGAHGHKAARAKLNAPGGGKVCVAHRVVVVGLLEHAAKPGRKLAGQQQPRRGLAARQMLQPPVRVAQLRGHHGGTGLCQQPFGHRLQNIFKQNDIGIQDKMHIAMQFAKHGVVAPAKADILRQAKHLHAGVGPVGFGQLLAAAVVAGIIYDIQCKIRRGRKFQDTAHRSAHFLVITIRHNAGGNGGHDGLLKFVVSRRLRVGASSARPWAPAMTAPLWGKARRRRRGSGRI